MTSIVGLMTLIFPKEGQTVLAKPTDMNSLQDWFTKITALSTSNTTPYDSLQFSSFSWISSHPVPYLQRW